MGELTVDVVVIGGGPAGMSAALVLGRARRSVIVVDAEQPRNRVTAHSNGFLTRDGIAPGEFRAIAREQIAAYPTVRFERDTVTDVTGENGSFTTHTASGTTIRSKKVLFATGMKDVLPEIDGLTAVYGKSAFVCPYCDGWEMQNRPLVVIAKGDKAHHLAKTLRGWSDNITICSDGPLELSDAERNELTAHQMPVHEQRIAQIESRDGQVTAVHLADGTKVPCGGIFFTPGLTQSTDLPQKLGCRIMPGGEVYMEKGGQTSVPGVYVAGDAGRDGYQLIIAAADGSVAAIAINMELLNEEWRAKL